VPEGHAKRVTYNWAFLESKKKMEWTIFKSIFVVHLAYQGQGYCCV
jgi:hypothetical protein